MSSGGSTLQYLVYHCLEPVPTIVEVAFGTPPQAIVQAVTTMGGRFGDDRVGGFVVEVWVEEMNGWVDASVRIEELVARRKVRVAAAPIPPALPQLPQLPDLSVGYAAPAVPSAVSTTDNGAAAVNPPALPQFPQLNLSSLASAPQAPAVHLPVPEVVSPAVPSVAVAMDITAAAANSTALPPLPPLPDLSGVGGVSPAVDANEKVKLEVFRDILQQTRDGMRSSTVHRMLKAARRDLFEEKECRYALIELGTSNDLMAIKYTDGSERKVKLTEFATADELLEGIIHASPSGRIAYSEMTSTMAKVRPDLFGNEKQQHAAIEKAVADNRLFVSEQDVDGQAYVSFPSRHRGGMLRFTDRLAEIVATKGGSMPISDLVEEGVKLLHEQADAAGLPHGASREKTLGGVDIAQDQGLFVMSDNENGVPFVKLGPAWRGLDHSKGPTAEEHQKVLDVIVEQVANGSAKTLVELERAVEKSFPDLCCTKKGRDAFIRKAAVEKHIRIWEPLHDKRLVPTNVAIPGSDRDELDREFGVLLDVMRNKPNGMTFAEVSEELERCNPRRFRDQRDADKLIRRAIDYTFLVKLDLPRGPLILADEASDAQLARSILMAYATSRRVDIMDLGCFVKVMRRARGNEYCWKAKTDTVIEDLVAAGDLFRSISKAGAYNVSFLPIDPTGGRSNARPMSSTPCDNSSTMPSGDGDSGTARPLSSTIRNRNIRAVVRTIEDHGENGVMNEADAKRKLSQLREYRSAKKCDEAFDEALFRKFVFRSGRSDVRILDRRKPENATSGARSGASDAKRQRSPPRPEAEEAPLVLPQYKPPPFAGSVAMPVGAPLPQYVPPSHQPGPAPPLDFDEGLPMALPRLEEPPTAFCGVGGPPQQ